MKIVIYAMGGGWGHLTRSAALAQHLPQALILTNSPYAGIVSEASPDLAIEPIATCEQAVHKIQEASPDILIVDTFPRGLCGELASVLPALNARKVFIHRDLSPDYIEWATGLRAFVADQYQRVLCPGERGSFADLPQACVTDRWVVRAPIAPPYVAPVVICASGNRSELDWYGEVCAGLGSSVQCLALELPPGCPRHFWIRHWPAIDYIAQAQVVVGGAGYNTVAECMATGTPLIAKPWPRKYDRQGLRAEEHAEITIVETAAEAVQALQRQLARPKATRPPFHNGAPAAAAMIQSLWSGG